MIRYFWHHSFNFSVSVVLCAVLYCVLCAVVFRLPFVLRISCGDSAKHFLMLYPCDLVCRVN